MARRDNTIISKTFTYNLPDAYLLQTSDNGLTATYTYNGPDKLWVFVDETTGKITNGMFYTEFDDGEFVPTPVGMVKVKIDANTNPLMACLFHDRTEITTLPTTEEDLPDGSKFILPNPVPPNWTYEFSEIEYDISSGGWKTPLPWKKPTITWEQIRRARTAMLRAADQQLMSGILTDEQKTTLLAYREQLRNVPDLFDGYDAWKVRFPLEPSFDNDEEGGV